MDVEMRPKLIIGRKYKLNPIMWDPKRSFSGGGKYLGFVDEGPYLDQHHFGLLKILKDLGERI